MWKLEPDIFLLAAFIGLEHSLGMQAASMKGSTLSQILLMEMASKRVPQRFEEFFLFYLLNSYRKIADFAALTKRKCSADVSSLS